MINKVILLGNVGKDPEVNYIQPEVAVAKFSLATDDSYKRKDGTWENRSQWHNIVAWRYNAQYVEKNIRKGMLVYIEGKIQTRKYEDQNGQDKYITEIVANTIRVLNKRENSEGQNFNSQDSANAPQVSQTQQQNVTKNEDPFTKNSDSEDDLPF
jgi:single-strand DNA-binding protein